MQVNRPFRPNRRQSGNSSTGLRRNAARWIATAILLIVAAVFGRDYFPRSEHPRRGDPFPGELAGYGRPVDGDSLFVGRDEVRLKGIDAPEGRQSCTRGGASWACGNAARDELTGLIGRDEVICRVVERDMHGRLLSYCTAGGRDLNKGMVASGMAVAYGGYLREEGEAKLRKRGLWASEFTRPREWRDKHNTSSSK